MLDLMIDAGHGGKDPGAVGPTVLQEKDITLKLAPKVGNLLTAQGVKIGYTRTTDVFVELDDRAAMANNAEARYFLSIHINSAGSAAVTGTETFAYAAGAQGEKLAKAIQSNLVANIKLPDRGVKFANFAVLRETNMPAALTEVCFICNPTEEALLKDDAFLDKAALGIAKGVVSFLGLAWKDSDPQQNYFILTPIMGTKILHVSQMVSYAKKGNGSPKLPNCSLEELAQLFIEEATIEGVVPEVAWVQSLKETGYFAYGGIVLPEQNNYAGIGALNGNSQGQAASFESPRLGVRAQIQHLKAYASTEALKQACVDPRFSLVKRGAAKYVEWLGAGDNPNGVGWAYPGKGYGADIVGMLKAMTKEAVVLPPPQEKPEDDIPEWQRQGLEKLTGKIISDPDYWSGRMKETITVGEVLGILGKMMN